MGVEAIRWPNGPVHGVGRLYSRVVSGDADNPETPAEETVEGESTIDRRGFLRAAGMYSGTLAVGAAALRHTKKEKPRKTGHAGGARSQARSSTVRTSASPTKRSSRKSGGEVNGNSASAPVKRTTKRAGIKRPRKTPPPPPGVMQ